MAKFVAGALSKIEWDFSAVGGRKGAIPEPSAGELDDFLVGVSALMRKYDPSADVDEGDVRSVADTLEELGDDFLVQQRKEMLELVATICKNEPTKDEINALGGRDQQLFIGYVMGELSNPEAEQPANRSTRRRVR